MMIYLSYPFLCSTGKHVSSQPRTDFQATPVLPLQVARLFPLAAEWCRCLVKNIRNYPLWIQNPACGAFSRWQNMFTNPHRAHILRFCVARPDLTNHLFPLDWPLWFGSELPDQDSLCGTSGRVSRHGCPSTFCWSLVPSDHPISSSFLKHHSY